MDLLQDYITNLKDKQPDYKDLARILERVGMVFIAAPEISASYSQTPEIVRLDAYNGELYGTREEDGSITPFVFTRPVDAAEYAQKNRIQDPDGRITLVDWHWNEGLYRVLYRGSHGLILNEGMQGSYRLSRQGMAQVLAYMTFEEFFSQLALYVLTRAGEIYFSEEPGSVTACAFFDEDSALAGLPFFQLDDRETGVTQIPVARFVKKVLQREATSLVINPSFPDERIYNMRDIQYIAERLCIDPEHPDPEPSEVVPRDASLLSTLGSSVPEAFTPDDDMDLTHAINTILHAGHQGRAEFYRILEQLEAEAFDPDELKSSLRVLKAVESWIKIMWTGKSIIGKERDETASPRHIAAIELVQDLRKDLVSHAAKVSRYLARQDFAFNSEFVKYLIAAFCRYSFSREHYVRGMAAYGSQFGHESMSRRWQKLLPRCNEDAALAESYFIRFKDQAGVDSEYFEHLFQDTLILPGYFRTRAHDIGVILGKYRGKLTFWAAGFDEVESSHWREAGFDPQGAGYWQAYSFGSDEALEWIAMGFTDPAFAGDWKCRGIDLDRAVEWNELKFSPEEAFSWIRVDVDDPDQAAAWRKNNIPPSEAREWIRKGIRDPEETDSTKS